MPISQELKRRLIDLAHEFDETLDMENPANSEFSSEEAEAAFKARDIRLAGQLQNALGPDFSFSIKV